MIIKKVIVGALRENCYVLFANDKALIIDPGSDANKIKSLVRNKKVLAILVTHYHFDHVGALDELKEFFKIPVIDYKSKKVQKIGPFSFEIIDTKGHKEDSVTYYFRGDKVMFVGDFIFKNDVGRCDLAGGSFNEMLHSLKKMKDYDDDITLYPGHGKKTTLKDEKNNTYWWCI